VKKEVTFDCLTSFCMSSYTLYSAMAASHLVVKFQVCVKKVKDLL
jgi:hypothetical protein